MCLDAEGTFQCSVVIKTTVNATFENYSVEQSVFIPAFDDVHLTGVSPSSTMELLVLQEDRAKTQQRITRLKRIFMLMFDHLMTSTEIKIVYVTVRPTN